MSNHPAYFRVFATFMRNSLVRDMTFRTNFLIDAFSSVTWTLMNIGFYLVIFSHTKQIGAGTGWGRDEFFIFLATTMLVNSLVQAFFMPNCEELSESIRTGGLDFALLKPIDTQFLISLQKIEWSALSNFVAGGALLAVGLSRLMTRADNPLVLHPMEIVLYPLYVLCGVAILYSLMIGLAATSIYLGRNESLYDFWFYITNFSRYPMEIYSGRFGLPLQLTFTYLIPVLVVVNVPARILAQPLRPEPSVSLPLALFALLAAAISVVVSRRFFVGALEQYRSASS